MKSRSAQARLVVLHNAIDPKRLNGVTPSLRQELGLLVDDCLAGSVAHFVEGKHPMTIARALGEVFKKMPNLHFVFVGSRDEKHPRIFDECRDFCRQLQISERIHFLGAREDVPAIMLSLDLLVQSSSSETFGLVPVEAMYLGIPVLLSRIPAFSEVTGGDRNAMFFEEGNHSDLAARLLSVLTNTRERLETAAAGQQWVKDHYMIEDHLRGLRQAYHEALRRRNQARVIRRSRSSIH
jgi:glycosyltransferase involved in cell wall biosynthesis